MSVKVSICIPTYNNVSEAERLLKSIYSQDYKNFEVNISDDSTNDDIELMICNNYMKQYGNINYRHNSKPYGHIFNWNAAINMAGGEYIKIMFSDDWFTCESCLGKFVAMLDENAEAMLAFSGSRQVMLDESMRYYDRCADNGFIERLNKDYRLLFLGNQIGAPSAVIYRRNGSLTLFDEKSNWASDMYLYFDLLIKSSVFAYTKEPLVSIGVHNNQYTESFCEKDMRIYNDYKYMYTKYDLSKSDECKEYFTEKFIVAYNKGISEAKSLGIGTWMYLHKSIQGFFKSLSCFVSNKLPRKTG